MNKDVDVMDERFLSIVENGIKCNWERPAFSDYRGNTYLYEDFAVRIAKLHILFEQAGVVKGDRVALVGRNSAHWAMSFFAILSYGAVVVPILHEFKPDNVSDIIEHSEARVLMASDGNMAELKKDCLDRLELVVQLEAFTIIKSAARELSTEGVEAIFKSTYPSGYGKADVKYHIEEPDELAVLNYTSGTVSFSKGVMLPYRSLWSNTRYANDNIPFVNAGDNIVCMLPMAHMYGLAFEVLNGVGKGCHMHFLPRIPSPNLVLEAISTLKPTLILAVPLIIEKILKNRVFPMLKKPYVKLALKIPGIRSVILNSVATKLNHAFGDKFGEIVIGGAALDREAEAFLRKIKFRYTVGYGLTECGPLVAYEQWDSFRPASVGRVVDRMEVRVNEPDAETKVGEIWVRGMNTMLGYYKKPEATQAIMSEDGWMNTGDLGFVDEDGFIFLKGRSKTMILGANGQNIYPEEIESQLNNYPMVLESLIIQRDGKLAALICYDRDAAASEGLSDSDVERKMEANIEALNRLLPVYSKISSFTLHDQEFEKTPKRSIKRYLYQPVEK